MLFKPEGQNMLISIPRIKYAYEVLEIKEHVDEKGEWVEAKEVFLLKIVIDHKDELTIKYQNKEALESDIRRLEAKSWMGLKQQ